MATKLRALKAPKHFSYRPVLIHANGVNASVLDEDYFYAIIDLAELLQPIAKL